FTFIPRRPPSSTLFPYTTLFRSLIPQKREFFDLYNRAAENIVAIAGLLVELLDRYPDGADDLGREVKDLEHEGDRLTHELVDLRSEEHTSELQSLAYLVCRLLLE